MIIAVTYMEWVSRLCSFILVLVGGIVVFDCDNVLVI